MRKAAVTAAVWLALSAAVPTAASAQELTLGGQAVGIQAGTQGVIVAGLTQVESDGGAKSPAESAGVQKGDVISEINGVEAESASALIDAVAESGGKSVELTLRRGDKTLRVPVQPVQNREGQWMLGLWLKDGVSGIGTLTFCDPATGVYGALGHSISDADSGALLPVGDGTITDAEIVSVTRGKPGAPGELNGCADVGRTLGTIEANTVHGIFGKACTALGTRRVETGEITTGAATILSTVAGRQTREYSVEINRIYRDNEGAHVMLTVTDGELTALTGGIVQGMSGSPIIQGGKLVGAVTHVFVNDPTHGYGVSIQDMLASAGLTQKAAA